MAHTAVERFIIEHISSVEQLEFLLLMRQHPRPWTAEQLAKELRTSLASARAKIRDLTQHGLISPSALADAFVYSPPENMQTVITELARQYHERRVAIISTIYSKPAPDLQAFSDAFRLRANGGVPPPGTASPSEPPATEEEKKE
jgi:hypothetical protein